jgi:carboxymethylenebutenolidase
MMKLLVTLSTVWYICFSAFWAPKPTLTLPPQPETVMCHSTATDMAEWAQDPRFQAAHAEPVTTPMTLMGKNIRFKVADGKKGNAYLVKAKRKSDKWLFVYQEWWGLNDHIRNQADQFYTNLDGAVNVMAIDMYDGKSTADRKEAANLMQGVNETRLEALVRGAQKRAGNGARIASVGWCFGGGWSLKSALITEKQSVGCIIYYGMPVREVERLKTLNTDVLGIFATEEWISKEIVEDFAAKMKEAGKSLNYKIFPGVHGFANPSNPKHDVAASKEAFEMSVGYLKGKFGMK